MESINIQRKPSVYGCQRPRQAGLTLAETLLVLAIGALAIVGGTLLYLQATAGNKLNPAFPM